AVADSPSLVVAAADTVMNRPSATLLAEVFPGVSLDRGVGEFGSLLATDRARETIGYQPRRSWRDHLAAAPPPPTVPTARTKPYHHGDLKAALIDGAVDLIVERGVRRFSLAELSRRLGVTVAAPYRHFASRDELLVAVAVRALQAFGEALANR